MCGVRIDRDRVTKLVGGKYQRLRASSLYQRLLADQVQGISLVISALSARRVDEGSREPSGGSSQAVSDRLRDYVAQRLQVGTRGELVAPHSRAVVAPDQPHGHGALVALAPHGSHHEVPHAQRTTDFPGIDVSQATIVPRAAPALHEQPRLASERTYQILTESRSDGPRIARDLEWQHRESDRASAVERRRVPSAENHQCKSNDRDDGSSPWSTYAGGPLLRDGRRPQGIEQFGSARRPC